MLDRTPCIATRSMREEADARRGFVRASMNMLLTRQSVPGLARQSVARANQKCMQLYNQILTASLRRIASLVMGVHIAYYGVRWLRCATANRHVHSKSALGRSRHMLRREHMQLVAVIIASAGVLRVANRRAATQRRCEFHFGGASVGRYADWAGLPWACA